MPETIPKVILLGKVVDKIAKGIQVVFRTMVVAVIWLAILPYFTIWVWRLYFWIGETFAFRANGLDTPLWNSTTFFASRHNLTSAPSTPTPATGADKALEGISLLFFQSIAPEHQWISKFILDCFEGQVISSVVVVVFIAIFLLREWVLQNQEGDDLGMDVDAAAAAVPGDADGQGFNVEHAVERFIAAQHHIEAVVEGEADLSDDDNNSNDDDDDDDESLDNTQRDRTLPEAQNPTPMLPLAESWNLRELQTQAEASRTESAVNLQGPRPGFFWDNGNSGEEGSSSTSTPAFTLNPSISPLGSWPSESGQSSGSTAGRPSASGQDARPSNDRTFSSDPTTGIYASTNAPDKGGRRPSALDGLGQGYSYRAPEDLPKLGDLSTRVGYVYDSLNQTYYPDTRWPSTSASSAANGEDFQHTGGSIRQWSGQNPSASHSGEGPSNSQQPLQGQSKDFIRSKNGAPLYWKGDIPLTYDNVYLNTDGTEMSFSEKVSRYEDLSRTGDLTFADVRRLPLLYRPAQVSQAQIQVEGLPEAMDTRAQQRQEMVRQINERGIQMRARHGAVPQEQDVAVENAPRRPMPARAAQPPPPPAPPAPGVNPVIANEDLDDIAVEDLDGILEVIGMHGSYWILLQNSLLMSALMCASLGLGVWIPFMIGKTTLLMSPINVLRVPHMLLSRLTDPILDFVLDRVFPFLTSIFSKCVTALASRLSPHMSPLLGSYLGTSAAEPLELLYQDYILPTWNALIEVTTSGVAQEASVRSEETILQSGSAGIGNSTVVHRVVRKWSEVAYGNSSSDKFAAVLIGYAILFMIASWYFARTRSAYGNTFARVVRDVLLQQGLILKIAIFVAIDMILFPLFCGMVIGISTLPVFKGATVASRIAFYQNSPNWSLIMHWLVGTAFMFNFSFFVSVCRKAVRSGVMWFIRDPTDQGFHPVREILERPAMLQLRKLGSGALMYFTLIVLGLGLTTHSVNLVKGALPLRWPVDEPISDFPVDLLLFHLIVPLTARWLDPTKLFKALFEAWWRKLSHWLRLSSFMYGTEGQRFPDEEGYIVYRTWSAWLTRARPPIPGANIQDEDAVGSGEELDIDAPVLFIRDGGLSRVPNSDRIVHLKNRRIIVPVDEAGNALDPEDDQLGEIDPLMEIQPRAREGPRPLIDPKENTIVVYTPPNFKYRVITFVILIWTSVMYSLVLAAVIPTVLGREIFAMKTDRKVHDVYSFIVGVYAVRCCWFLMDWMLSQYRVVASGGVQSIDAYAQLRTLSRLCKTFGKLLYFGLSFGVVIPFFLGLLFELYVVLPFRSYGELENGIMFVMNWATGLLYMKMAHRILTAMPNNRFGATLNRLFVGVDVNTWDAGLITRQLIVPIIGMCALAILGPFGLAWTTAKCLNLDHTTRLKVFKQIYPAILMISLIVYGLRESVAILQGWVQYVRDQEYLVGRQLHNLREEEEELVATPSSEASAFNEGGLPDNLEATVRAAPLLRHRFVEDVDAVTDEQDDWYTTREDSVDSKEMGAREAATRQVGEDSEEEGTIAQRTRSRTHQRLQAREAMLGQG
ncbi:hypothetical protein BGZ75_001097 [Mortierella antarctica]|nr:hypothetical protein BGZ75_001097 [Mortierella antarctica]